MNASSSISLLSASPKILACSCKHEYQEKKYGKQLRVHNPCKAGATGIGHRCTVCGSVK